MQLSRGVPKGRMPSSARTGSTNTARRNHPDAIKIAQIMIPAWKLKKSLMPGPATTTSHKLTSKGIETVSEIDFWRTDSTPRPSSVTIPMCNPLFLLSSRNLSPWLSACSLTTGRRIRSTIHHTSKATTTTTQRAIISRRIFNLLLHVPQGFSSKPQSHSAQRSVPSKIGFLQKLTSGPLQTPSCSLAMGFVGSIVAHMSADTHWKLQ
mmetsp:Transcript_129685/g.224007  ORF Transcript_129685/g.224007 Transcript_129685/m.224007 type:complete len:208 (+) Transcript_129685:128-751(+)